MSQVTCVPVAATALMVSVPRLTVGDLDPIARGRLGGGVPPVVELGAPEAASE